MPTARALLVLSRPLLSVLPYCGPACGNGTLAFRVQWWEGVELHRTSLLLPGSGGPPQRQPDEAGRVGDVDEVLLMARETAAWRRCVQEAGVPSLDAYLAECCA